MSPAELDVLVRAAAHSLQTSAATMIRRLCSKAGSMWVVGQHGAIDLPKDLLPTVNRTAKLARALFDSKGIVSRCGFPFRGHRVEERAMESRCSKRWHFARSARRSFMDLTSAPQPSLLRSSGGIKGFPLVGIESTSARSGRRHSQTLEVADSAWSLFRLLQKSTLESDGESTWRIHDEGAGEVQVIRFVITPDPWLLFRIAAP